MSTAVEFLQCKVESLRLDVEYIARGRLTPDLTEGEAQRIAVIHRVIAVLEDIAHERLDDDAERYGRALVEETALAWRLGYSTAVTSMRTVVAAYRSRTYRPRSSKLLTLLADSLERIADAR